MKALEGKWKGAILAAVMYFLVVLAYEVPVQVANHFGTFQGLMSFYALGIMFFVLFPIAYSLSAAILKASRNSEHSIFSDMTAILKKDYTRGLACYLLILAYVLLLFIPVIIVSVIIVLVIVSQLSPTGLAGAAEWMSTNMVQFMCITYGVVFIVAIPVVVFAYMIRLLPFIAFEHPEMPLRKALKKSCKLMSGHKWQAFVLDLTYLGWGLLVVCTAGLASVFVLPYQTMAQALFYEDILAEKAAAENPQEEVTPQDMVTL